MKAANQTQIRNCKKSHTQYTDGNSLLGLQIYIAKRSNKADIERPACACVMVVPLNKCRMCRVWVDGCVQTWACVLTGGH